VGVVKSLKISGEKNALTIDVEDWFQVANLQRVISYDDWEKCESRVFMNMIRILDILAKTNVKATFFVLGWIAEKTPEIVQIIHSEGHEIASHGYSHRNVYELTENDFRQEIAVSIELIESITHQSIIGFRAPNYSIKPDTKWAWKILAQFGIKYDSSIFPVKHDRYGFLAAPRFPFTIDLKEDGKLVEFPLSTIRIWGNNIPVAGGAYLRLYPYWFIRAAIKKLNADGNPAIIYLHPWELDANQPRQQINFMAKFRHYGNLLVTEHKLKRLLDDFPFAPIREVLQLQ